MQPIISMPMINEYYTKHVRRHSSVFSIMVTTGLKEGFEDEP